MARDPAMESCSRFDSENLKLKESDFGTMSLFVDSAQYTGPSCRPPDRGPMPATSLALVRSLSKG